MSTSIYAGSFDPITKGHEWVIEHAPRELIVAVADNPGKTYQFDIEKRAEMVRRSVGSGVQVVVVGNGYLVDFAIKAGASFIVRGVRSVADYEYERGYADVNRTIHPGPVHLLMMPPPELASVSSSVVRSLVGPEGWETVVARYVSPHVLEALRG